MTDERLRELERRWRASGEPADELAWLLERVRHGDPWPERIHFPGNPWPAGHRIRSLKWSARLDPQRGVWFRLELESAEYDEDDPPGADELDDRHGDGWRTRDSWHRNARIAGSFLAGSAERKLDFARLAGREFLVDPVTEEGGPPIGLAFEAGLREYGHDAVADHRIRFLERIDAHTWWLSWRGRVGDDELDLSTSSMHREFLVPIQRVCFDGIIIPLTVWVESEARELLGRFVRNSDELEFVHGADRKFVLGESA